MSSLRVGKSFPQLLTRDEVFTSIKKLRRCMHLKRLNFFISILNDQKSFYFFIGRGIGRGKKKNRRTPLCPSAQNPTKPYKT